MDYGVFNVRTDVNACDCTRGFTDTVRESALSVDSGRKISPRTGESNLRRRRVGLELYQLSYIPTPPLTPLVVQSGLVSVFFTFLLHLSIVVRHFGATLEAATCSL